MAATTFNAPSIERGRTFDDFSDGMENVPDISAISEKALSEIVNMELDASGSLVSRPPYVKIASPLVGGQAIDNLGWFNRSDGISLMVLAHNGKTYLYNPVSPAWTEIATFVASACTQYQNRLYLVSRTVAGGWWGEDSVGSGSYSWHDLSGGAKPMPKGDQIILFRERLFIAGWGNSDERTKVYLSEVTNTVGGDINNWPPLNFFYVGRGDGQYITRLHPGPNDITIFRNESSAYFTYDSDPTLGALNWYEGKIGCDNKYALGIYQNYVYVVSKGALYQLISYQFYRRNDPAKYALTTATTATPFRQDVSLSVLGSRMIVWYSGGIHVYNVTTNSWSQWESTHQPGVFSVMQRPAGYFGSDVAYGITASGESAKWGIYRISDDANFVDKETMLCRITTKAYDYQTPDRYKTLYWWMADVLIAGDATGTAIPIVLTATTTTWDDMSAKTWDELSLGTWDHPLIKAPGVATSRSIPSGSPSRVSLKFRKKMRFRRVYFEVSMTTDGSAATGPVHLFSLVTYMNDNQKINRGVT